MKKILITGVAGFIGYHLSKKLLNNNYHIIGIDNINDYYDPNLKKSRLNNLIRLSNFEFHKVDFIKNKELIPIFENNQIDLSERPNEIIRAAMESIGFLVNDILNCIKTAGLDLPTTLTDSGGGAKSSLLQFIANITGKTIRHLLVKDKTAFGVYRILSSNYLNQISKEEIGEIFYPEKIPTLRGKIDKWEQSIKVLERL